MNIVVDTTTDSKGWILKLLPSGQDVFLQLWVPENAPVGDYDMIVYYGNELYPFPQTYILFNPWSSLDDVYMPDSSDISEYVLNEVGLLWQGSYANMGVRVWYYEQFLPSILPAVMYILRKTSLEPINLKPEERGDVVKNNVNDDFGVIEGRWGNSFEGGTYPWDWTGSAAILLQYQNTDQPVKYGQCWVFAAVLTTMLRALGCPTRPISNFNSGHGADDDMVVDEIIQNHGKSADSYWNFHVWNEVWMKRKDLQSKNADGWQVVDSTPLHQSRAEKRFILGPASVKLVRDNDLKSPFENSFVYCEVNCDFMQWLEYDDESYLLQSVNYNL
ncbi:Protein-glutamine gamma-glutamyltransferase 4-like protein [Dinothrombium tinctorium]|uniref:Protein-glutamine gamma-glutamyltransferase 4-like protein n=1 Tax=Dinothrombium tinctorium TaxID=1965070 RepID=A0A443QZQ1_9ACAR|nr:Protein-glutamine gamma-glutamyltransferase 4-like protein [Dinothrombium tinctorium]